MPEFMRDPLTAFAIVFVFGFVVTLLIRPVIEHHFYWTRWWSFRLGVFFAATYCAFTARFLQDHAISHAWLINFYLHAGLILVGLAVAIFLEVDANKKGRDSRITALASNLYFVPGLSALIWLTAWNSLVLGAFIIDGDTDPVWVLSGALISLILLGATVYVDNCTDWVDHTPERYEDGKRV
ncbi:MAG TPA: hypothetical protein VG965_01050 [Patescibacteria group bacterium]|nr:hypothetical protein [Patescibacteria group bacterium]